MPEHLKLEIPHSTVWPMDRLAHNTYQGMAHFAGTGPLGATCRDCTFLDNTNTKGTKPRACRKFTELTGRKGKVVPLYADACKYFQAVKSK